MIERNPMHEAGAGEIGSILNNESQGGDVLGRTRRLNEVPSDRETTEQGIIVGEKKNYMNIVLEQFENWVQETPEIPQINILGFNVCYVEVFRIVFAHTRRMDAVGNTSYMQDIYPIMRVLKDTTIMVNGKEVPLKAGTFVKGPNSLRAYGVNPEWYEWNERKKQYDSSNSLGSMPEPPYYTGFIHEWTEEYGCPDNLLTNNLHLNNRFLLPQTELKAIIYPTHMISEFKKMIDESKVAKG